MKSLRILFGLVCTAMLAPALSAAERTTARLILSAAQARPGATVWAGVELHMPPRWHTYWRNAGDSGMATKIDWQLPSGVIAGEIQWPVPEKLVEAELTTYIYHDSVVLLVPLKLADHLAPGLLDIKADVSWLECEKVCLPGGSQVKARLAIGTEFKASSDAPIIERWKKKLPVADPALTLQARWENAAADDGRPLLIEWTSPSRLVLADFFPNGSDGFEVAGATDRLKRDGNSIALRKIVRKFGPQWPAQIEGLIVTRQTAEGETDGRPVLLRLRNSAKDKN